MYVFENIVDIIFGVYDVDIIYFYGLVVDVV